MICGERERDGGYDITYIHIPTAGAMLTQVGVGVGLLGVWPWPAEVEQEEQDLYKQTR